MSSVAADANIGPPDHIKQKRPARRKNRRAGTACTYSVGFSYSASAMALASAMAFSWAAAGQSS